MDTRAFDDGCHAIPQVCMSALARHCALFKVTTLLHSCFSPLRQGLAQYLVAPLVSSCRTSCFTLTPHGTRAFGYLRTH